MAERGYGRAYADYFALSVEQRPSRIARIDGGIGLDKIVVRTRADTSALRADDARRNGVGITKGIADGHDPIAGLQPVRVP